MRFFLKPLLLLALGILCASQSKAQNNIKGAQTPGIVLSDGPHNIDTNALYLFYISGYIVEAGNTRPTSPKFGVYEYAQILDTFKQSGFIVISEARKQTTDIESYAAKVAERVRRLLNAGIPAQNITVVGASQGGQITMLISTYLKRRDLNYVVIGACGADEGFLKLVDLHGSVLFIAERTERYPISLCQRFRDDATGLVDHKEVETNTGQEHGFLYRPMKEWVEPTIGWAQKHSKVSVREK
jgi:hypothetical protein